MAKFSKQHYQMIAKGLNNLLRSDTPYTGNGGTKITKGEKSGVILAASELARIFADDNERFDYDHFLAVVRGERPVNSRPLRS